MPSFVAEYGSTIADRPGPFAAGWGDMEQTPGARAGEPATWRPAWRAGEAVWAGFDHGSIAGKFGWMGIVDYSRLPKRAWHWYRQHNLGIKPPAWPEAGVAAGLRLSASAPAIRRTDGTDDVQLVITVVDAQGRALSNSPPVKLAIESGPGELPTGREIAFTPDGDIPSVTARPPSRCAVGKPGLTRLRASSPGLKDGVLAVPTLKGPAFVAGKTPLAAPRPTSPTGGLRRWARRCRPSATRRPSAPAPARPATAPSQANDGAPDTYWSPATSVPPPGSKSTPSASSPAASVAELCAWPRLRAGGAEHQPHQRPERLDPVGPGNKRRAGQLTLPLADRSECVCCVGTWQALALACAWPNLEGHLRD